MKRFDDIQRQIEIAAVLCEHPERYSEDDLADQFAVSVATIRRDVKALRDMGVPVYSRKRAYRLAVGLEELNWLITTYLSFGESETVKNLPLVHEKLRHKTLSFFVNTMKAIREGWVIELAYRSARSREATWRTVTPIAVYNAGKAHYLIAVHGSTPKMFTLERIHEARFPRQPSPLKEIPRLADLFRYAWGSFTGGAITSVRLRFREDLEPYLAEKFWIDTQRVAYTDRGLEVTMRIRISNEFIAWILGWGDSVEVLEPAELRDMVVQRAGGIVKLYRRKR